MKYLRIYLYGFFLVLANVMVTLFLSLYLKSRGIGEERIGHFLGGFNAVLPVVVLSFGLLADRFSCRRMIMTGSLVSLLFCLSMPRLTNLPVMFLSVILGGIGLSLSFVTLNILFLKIVERKGRGRHVSIFVAFMTSGYAVGSSVSSILINEMHLPMEYIFHLAVPFHLLCLVLVRGFPESPIERFPIGKYLHDMKRPPVVILALIAFALGMHWGSENFSTVRFLKDIIGASGWQMVMFFLGTGVFLAIFSRMAGHIVDNRGGIVLWIAAGMALSGATHALTSLTRTFPQFFMLRALHTCGDGIITFAVPMLVSVAFPRGRMGGNYGFNRTIINIGATIGCLASGYIVSKTQSLGAPYTVMGIFQIFTAVVILMGRGCLPHDLKSSEPDPEGDGEINREKESASRE